MDSKEFVRLALKTESNDFEKIRERAHEKIFIVTLLETFQAAIKTSYMLDSCKKHLFYGKPLDTRLTNPDSIIISDDWLNDIRNHMESKQEFRLLHGILGLSTESGELIEAIARYLFHDCSLDTINIQEELGDLDWYKAIIVDELKVSFEDIYDRTILKLKARYGDKFNEEGAITRDLKKERVILEMDFHGSDVTVLSRQSIEPDKFAEAIKEAIEDNEEHF